MDRESILLSSFLFCSTCSILSFRSLHGDSFQQTVRTIAMEGSLIEGLRVPKGTVCRVPMRRNNVAPTRSTAEHRLARVLRGSCVRGQQDSAMGIPALQHRARYAQYPRAGLLAAPIDPLVVG
jgi:hypothetical protein